MTTTPVSRRVAVLGAATLATTTACATYGQRPGDSAPAAAPPAAAAPGTAPATGAGGPAAAPAPALAATTDIPVGGGIVLADQQIVVTQPSAGQFKAFSAICTHQGCTVSAVTDGAIKCPCHGSSFAVADGSVITGPARKPLPPRAVKVDGTSVTLG